MKTSPWQLSDLIVIPVLIFMSFGMIYFNADGDSIGKAVVISQGKHILELDLNEFGEYEVNGLKGILTIEINERGLHILESTCPHKFCIKQGYINKANQMLICVPNGIAIRIEGGSENKIDAVVG